MNFPELKEIDDCQLENVWDLGNKVLYDLCSENFDHSTDKKIVAKVWLIGRAYAAAIERGKKDDEDKEAESDSFYENKVVNLFKGLEIDAFLGNLKSVDEISLGNLNEILRIHKYLIDKIREIKPLDKRSFCSKYLHFHLPNLFFIYDSRAESAMRKIKLGKLPLKYTEAVIISKDETYFSFCIKCLYLRDEIQKEFKVKLTPRQIDNLLLERSKK